MVIADERYNYTPIALELGRSVSVQLPVRTRRLLQSKAVVSKMIQVHTIFLGVDLGGSRDMWTGAIFECTHVMMCGTIVHGLSASRASLIPAAAVVGGGG